MRVGTAGQPTLFIHLRKATRTTLRKDASQFEMEGCGSPLLSEVCVCVCVCVKEMMMLCMSLRHENYLLLCLDQFDELRLWRY